MRSRVSPPPLFSLDGVSFGAPGPPSSAPVTRRLGAEREPRPPGLAAATAAFSQIARARLGRSSNHVDELLDAAVADGSSIGDAIARVRRLSIRGVVPATLGALADELHRLLVERPDQGPPGSRSTV